MMTTQTLDDTRTTDPRHRHIALLLVVGAGISLALYLHGTGWWYAPMAFVLVHGAILGGVVLFASLTTVGRTEGTLATPGSVVIRRPWLYDRIVSLTTLGRERRFRDQVLDHAQIHAGADVLDVGCGTGTLLLAAAKRVGSSGALHGVEPAPEMIAHAREKAVAEKARLELQEGSADCLPYPDASFHVVLCTMVLHHLPRATQQQAIMEMRRVLRPGGRVVIVDLQRPRGLAAALSLITLLHGRSSSQKLLSDAQAFLEEAGFVKLQRESLGLGGLGAIVGRLSP